MLLGLGVLVVSNIHSHEDASSDDKEKNTDDNTDSDSEKFDDSTLSETGKKCVDGAVFNPVTDTCEKMDAAEDITEKCTDWNTGVEHYKTTDSALSEDYNSCQKRNACNVKYPDDGSNPKRLEDYYNCVHSNAMSSLRAFSV